MSLLLLSFLLHNAKKNVYIAKTWVNLFKRMWKVLNFAWKTSTPRIEVHWPTLKTMFHLILILASSTMVDPSLPKKSRISRLSYDCLLYCWWLCLDIMSLETGLLLLKNWRSTAVLLWLFGDYVIVVNPSSLSIVGVFAWHSYRSLPNKNWQGDSKYICWREWEYRNVHLVYTRLVYTLLAARPLIDENVQEVGYYAKGYDLILNF